MRIAEHVIGEHFRMFPDLAGRVQAGPGVVEIDLVLRVEPPVIRSAQGVERAGRGVGGVLLQELIERRHGSGVRAGRRYCPIS